MRGYLSRFQNIPGVDGVLVRWGMVVIVGLILWYVLLQPWSLVLDEDRELLVSRVMEVERLQALQLRETEWQAEEKKFHKAAKQSFQETLLTGKTKVAAKAELNRLLQLIIKSNALKVERQSFISRDKSSRIESRVAIQFRMTGTMANGYRFLKDVAEAEHVLLIEKLTLGRRGTMNMTMVVQIAGVMTLRENK